MLSGPVLLVESILLVEAALVPGHTASHYIVILVPELSFFLPPFLSDERVPELSFFFAPLPLLQTNGLSTCRVAACRGT